MCGGNSNIVAHCMSVNLAKEGARQMSSAMEDTALRDTSVRETELPGRRRAGMPGPSILTDA